MKRNWVFYVVTTLIWVVYVYLTFIAPTSPTTGLLGIDPTMTFVIRVTVIIPYLVVWLIAVFGALHLQDYSHRISGSGDDSQAYHKISVGVWFLVVGLIVSALLSTIRSQYIFIPDLHMFTTVLVNYSYVLFPLVGFWHIFNGARKLVKSVGAEIESKGEAFTAAILVSIFSLLYLIFFFQNPARQISIDPTYLPSYYLSDPMILLTIVAPIIVTWIVGIMAALNIKVFLYKVKGGIYKMALTQFVNGILGVIFASIMLQGLLSLGSAALVSLGLGLVLVVIYLFLAFQGIGYILMALGSKKLTKIEGA